MKIFSDILKPEEQLSGFAPGEPDDDIFMLGNDGEYTSDVPDFKEDISIEDNTTIIINPKVDNTIYEVPQKGSVWDIFVDANTADERSSIDMSSESDDSDSSIPDRLLNDDDTDEEMLSSQPLEKEEPDSEGYLFGDEVEIIKDERLNDFDEKDESDILFNAPTELDDEFDKENISDELVLDPDLLASIRNELEKISPPKIEIEEKNIETDDKPIFADKEVDNSIFIDITGLKVGDSPSTYGIINQESTSSDASSIQTQTSEKTRIKAEKSFDASEFEGILTEKEIKKKQKVQEKLDKKLEKQIQKDEKRKNRKALPWQAITTSTAIFVILSLLGTGGYYFWQINGYNLFAPKDEIAEVVPAKENVTETALIEEESIAETDNIPKVEESKKPTEVKPVETEKKSEAKQMPAPTPQVQSPQKKNEVADAKQPARQTAAPQQSKQMQQPKPTDPKMQTTASPKAVAPKQTAPPKAATQSIAKAEDKLPPAPTYSPSSKEVYTVQIYSTPSIEDAESWLRQLSTRQISEGYISTQKIREQTWYRVRFGKFATREEARAAAQKHGFAQSWVDRIK